MADRSDLKLWVLEALQAQAGPSTQIKVARPIWAHPEGDLRRLGHRFHTWQYDMRWAATYLRKAGLMDEGWALR